MAHVMNSENDSAGLLISAEHDPRPPVPGQSHDLTAFFKILPACRK